MSKEKIEVTENVPKDKNINFAFVPFNAILVPFSYTVGQTLVCSNFFSTKACTRVVIYKTHSDRNVEQIGRTKLCSLDFLKVDFTIGYALQKLQYYLIKILKLNCKHYNETLKMCFFSFKKLGKKFSNLLRLNLTSSYEKTYKPGFCDKIGLKVFQT